MATARSAPEAMAMLFVAVLEQLPFDTTTARVTFPELPAVKVMPGEVPPAVMVPLVMVQA